MFSDPLPAPAYADALLFLRPVHMDINNGCVLTDVLKTAGLPLRVVETLNIPAVFEN